MSLNLTAADALAVLRRRWWVPLLAGAIGIVVALALLAYATPTYQATAIIGPKKDFLSSNRTPGGLGGILGALQGGAANSDLIRLDLLLPSDRLAQEIWKSDALKRDLLPERWDSQKLRWKPRTGLGTILLRVIDFHQPDEPNVDDIRAKLDQILTIETQQQLYRVVVIRTPVRDRSKRLLEAVIGSADQMLRQDDRLDIDQLIEYSRTRLESVTLARQAEAVAATLLSLEQQRMYMLASNTYGFNYIQPSRVESRPSSPKPMLYLAAGALFPAMLVLVLMISVPALFRSRRRIEPDYNPGDALTSPEVGAEPLR